jgi:hypothetical protein
VVSAADSHGRQSRFSRPEPLLFLQVAPQLSSQGSVDSVPDPLLLTKSVYNVKFSMHFFVRIFV